MIKKIFICDGCGKEEAEEEFCGCCGVDGRVTCQKCRGESKPLEGYYTGMA